MVRIDGRPVGRSGVNDRRRSGAAFVPEERLGHGAVPAFRLSENVVLTRHGTGEGITTRGFTRVAAAGRVVSDVTGLFDVRTGTIDPEARSLSGGNLQKFVVGREVHRGPGILVVAQPTWGVDAGAAAVIRQALIDLARGGAAVLVISQDLDEIFEIADRIAVMSRGHLSDAREAGTLTREEIGLLMAGGAEKRAV
jgi:simple sugar transport system ATP-binding protein